METRPLGLGDGNRETYSLNVDGSYESEPGVFSVLVKNGNGTFTRTTTDQVRYNFDAQGRLGSVADRNANTITLAYDVLGNLATITDTVGRVIQFTSDASNRLTQITDPIGRHVRFTYNAAGDLTSASDLKGAFTTFAYDASHQITSATDPLGHKFVSMTYDAMQRVVLSQNDALGNKTQFNYDFVTRTTTLTAFTSLDGHHWNRVLQHLR